MIGPALARASGATEALKAANQMKWVRIMNACKAQTEEVFFQEIIFAYRKHLNQVTAGRQEDFQA